MPVAIGLVAGLGLGSLGAFALGGFIVGVSPIDPLTMVGTAVLLVDHPRGEHVSRATRGTRRSVGSVEE